MPGAPKVAIEVVVSRDRPERHAGVDERLNVIEEGVPWRGVSTFRHDDIPRNDDEIRVLDGQALAEAS